MWSWVNDFQVNFNGCVQNMDHYKLCRVAHNSWSCWEQLALQTRDPVGSSWRHKTDHVLKSWELQNCDPVGRKIGSCKTVLGVASNGVAKSWPCWEQLERCLFVFGVTGSLKHGDPVGSDWSFRHCDPVEREWLEFPSFVIPWGTTVGSFDTSWSRWMWLKFKKTNHDPVLEKWQCWKNCDSVGSTVQTMIWLGVWVTGKWNMSQKRTLNVMILRWIPVCVHSWQCFQPTIPCDFDM